MNNTKLTIFILFLLVSTFKVHAQVRQSLFSFHGIFDRLIFRGAIPYQGLQFDLERKDSSLVLESLSFNQHMNTPLDDRHTFSFLNEELDLVDVYNKDMGICRGYASLRRKFRLLAIFDPNNTSAEVIPDKDTDLAAFKKFYRKKIRDIRFYQPTTIPGYQNLKELSADPDLAPMIKWQVLYEWRRKNFTKGTGTSRLLKATVKKTNYKSLLETRNRLEYFLQHKINPLVWLTQKLSTWIHSVEAIAVTPVREDGSFTITFWNDKSHEGVDVYSFLDVDANGNMIYRDLEKPRPINGFGIVKENDGELQHIYEQWQDFCQQKPEHCPLR
jgi:hypothetical protein